MLMDEVSPASFFHGRVLLKLSKEANRLQPSSLLVEVAARLRELAIILE